MKEHDHCEFPYFYTNIDTNIDYQDAITDMRTK